MTIPPDFEAQIDEVITHYPVSKRSASLPLLHLFQEKFGYISDEAIKWIAQKLGLEPINILELVTFYPMFRQKPAGRTHIRVCRTLSCAMAGSYEEMKKALRMERTAIVNEVKASGLRGRGGAGFPCGVKWGFIKSDEKKPVYLICNADESEPGTFKDRYIIHQDPHQLLEGMIISCFAVNAKLAYLYIRGEFPEGARIMEKALAEARAKNFLGKNILGSGFDCEIYVHRGAGAYICGEETGLIESLEGKRAYPRIKPPYFPAVLGLYQCPTIVNNVETLCDVKHIVKMGGAEYAKIGKPNNTGTRILCVSGDVQRPGYYELEVGSLTLGELINDICGGMKPGRKLKAVIPG